MNFKRKLQTLPRSVIWEEYCGFLDLSVQDYMFIQNRLMEEQIQLFSASALGKKMMNGKKFGSVQDFLSAFPMTRYEDYADILLPKKADMLPGDPVIWIETTWEGGFRPIKVAPYTRSMLDTYRKNVLAIMMLASGRAHGNFTVADHDKILYGGAPLPYATGLLPSLLSEEMQFDWLPNTNANSDHSFRDRIKKGFKLAFRGGLDYFFAIGSVANYITEHFADAAGGKGIPPVSPAIAFRYLRAKALHREDGGKLVPGDLFRLKGFIATGTDSARYRDRLEKAWGVRPIEIAAGTESTCLATDTWEHRGMIFFPDACFYEFIPQSELQREQENPDYVPGTVLMDGVSSGGIYELVISVLHGGAFMRYRIGDMYHCLSAPADGSLPRFTFLDRTEDIIDIAGFTRITEASIEEIIRESRLSVGDWTAKKEFDTGNTPYLHLYLEFKEDSVFSESASRALLQEHLALYFRYFDSDYQDLKKLLDMEPLQITILKAGTIHACEKKLGRKIRHINPSVIDLRSLMEDRDDPVPPVLRREEGC